MKLLIITNHSYMFWQFRRELIEELLSEHEVVISTPFIGHEDALEELGCRLIETVVDRRSINPKTDMKLFRFYRKLLKEEKPDLVITYSIKPNIYAGMACRLAKIPYCVNVQGLGTAFQHKILAKFVAQLYKIALKKAKTTFFENEINAKEFRDYKIQKEEAQTVLNGAGVNLNHYSYEEYPENRVFRFLYLGRIMKEKGIDELFYSVKKLKEEGYDFILDIVGFYEDSYKEQIEALTDDGIVCFHGFQSDPRAYYKKADCVVLPSYHEGMSNVLLEASAVGRPIITSDIPGCREAICEEGNGLKVQAKDGESLYLAMKEMLSLPLEQREKLGMVGRAYMQERFNKESVVKTTVEHLFN